MAVSPVLITSLFLFIVRNGLQTGLDDPAENVLGSALPAQVGPKLKLLLDNLVLPGAAVVSGAGLALLQPPGPAPARLPAPHRLLLPGPLHLPPPPVPPLH